MMSPQSQSGVVLGWLWSQDPLDWTPAQPPAGRGTWSEYQPVLPNGHELSSCLTGLLQGSRELTPLGYADSRLAHGSGSFQAEQGAASPRRDPE